MLLHAWKTNSDSSYHTSHCFHIWFQRELTPDPEFLKLESWKEQTHRKKPRHKVEVPTGTHLSQMLSYSHFASMLYGLLWQCLWMKAHTWTGASEHWQSRIRGLPHPLNHVSRSPSLCAGHLWFDNSTSNTGKCSGVIHYSALAPTFFKLIRVRTELEVVLLGI